MDFFEVTQLLRRRWHVIVLTLIVGVTVGYLTAPGDEGRLIEYEATTTVLANPRALGEVNLEQAALLATTGQVPASVAELVGAADAEEARADVEAVANTDTRALTIRAVRADAERAETVSNAFAQVLVETLGASDQAAYQSQLDQLTQQVEELQARLDSLLFSQSLEPDNVSLGADLQAVQNQLSAALTELGQIQAQGSPQDALLIVEQGGAEEVDPEGVRAPDSKPARAALLGAFGLLLGIGAAFALDRLDTKIRNKSTAEAAFGYPVIAEIPPLPSRKHRDELIALTQPSAPFVEAYRGLRTVVALTAQTPSTNGRDGDKHGHVIVVTSPGAGEGKTTTAAHLAAMLAEVGRSVLVVSADLRRPRLHVLFDTEREPGLTEMLSNEGTPPDLRDLVKTTPINRVRLLPSGAPTANPAPLLRQAGEVLTAARRVFDFVIVDTAPLLIANDATELATVADGVIVIARATRTSIDAAQRSAELLNRLDTPVMGAVLVGATDTPTAYSYYRYRYYSEKPDKRPRRPKRRKRSYDTKDWDDVAEDDREAEYFEAR